MFAKQSDAKWRKKVQAKDPPKGDRNKNGPPNQKKEEEAAQHTNETKRKFTAHEQAKWYKNTTTQAKWYMALNKIVHRPFLVSCLGAALPGGLACFEVSSDYRHTKFILVP